MQLKRFYIKNLFNRFNHDIPLIKGGGNQKQLPLSDMEGPSVVIIHGSNGVGKTTVLRMIDGLLRLDFDVFRAVPFSECYLEFNTGEKITVSTKGKVEPSPLKVTFMDKKITLSPLHSGKLIEKNFERIDEFREYFFRATEQINFSLLDANRFLERNIGEGFDELIRLRYGLPSEDSKLTRYLGVDYSDQSTRISQRSSREKIVDPLARKVRSFINRAQVDYRYFFTRSEPDLFARILNQMEKIDTSTIDPSDLRLRLEHTKNLDIEYKRFGLSTDRWNFEQLNEKLSNPSISKAAINVMSAYVEVLESRTIERSGIAHRLETFERLMAEFFSGINIQMDRKDGFQIVTDDGERIHEGQLSSGEYHLLYLMVTALTTRRRGTVIAIDEPELSMHISWQSRLISALIECSSGAEPQYLLATHSPDLISDYSDSMIKLGEEY